MKLGIPIKLPSGPLLGARHTLRPQSLPCRPAQALSPSSAFAYSSASALPPTMLSQAHDRYKAKAPNPNLAKQLFPSSSPSHDADIAESFRKGRPSFGSSAGLGSVKTSNQGPLRTTSNNIVQPAAGYKRGTETSTANNTSANTLFSLCNNAGSFADETSTGTQNSQAKPQGSILINDDDFSDDDNLELDYECPAALPESSIPPRPVKLAAPRPPKPQQTISPAGPSTSQMTWSSSPQDHFFPPSLPQKKALKRESPDHMAAPRPPPAKKRTLPNSWRKPEPEAAVDDVPSRGATKTKQSSLLATPAAKQRPGVPWDMTLSATKEQRKQLKNQTKKPESDNHFSEKEIRAITQDHAKQKAKNSAISLSSEQQHVVDLVLKKKQSVFFTGPAGTGKSVLMRAIIAEMKKKWARDPERLSVTASTGLAACNIGGMTLHSFAGIGLGKDDVPTLVKKIRRNPKAKNRWLRTSVLIVDEISMVDGDLFDKLAQIARTIRNNGRPWGGIQLIITGDFFQLPPVPDGDKKRDVKFAFEAATWNTSIDHTIGLTQVFRQRDSHFADMLNEMRLGKISDDTVQTFKSLARPLNFDDGLDVTELFPTRQEVERSNETRLRALPGNSYHFDSYDTGDPNVRDKLLQNMMAPKGITLKKGAQVMLIKNMDDTLVNGSLGRIVGFMNEATFEIWGNRDEDSGSKAEGEDDARAKKKIQAFSRDAVALKDTKEYPVVKFSATDGSHRILLCVPEDWKVETPTGEVQASRKQLPLILAWALSIHKAQGQTLERVKVDLGKVFEKGQAYVALSRATSKQGLQVLRFEKGKVMAHPRVVTFYNKLYSAESALKAKKPATITDFAMGASSHASKKKGPTREVIDLDDEEEAMMAAYG